MWITDIPHSDQQQFHFGENLLKWEENLCVCLVSFQGKSSIRHGGVKKISWPVKIKFETYRLCIKYLKRHSVNITTVCVSDSKWGYSIFGQFGRFQGAESDSGKLTAGVRNFDTRVFEKMVLSRIFGPRSDEVTREWRKLHNEEKMICTPHPILYGW